MRKWCDEKTVRLGLAAVALAVGAVCASPASAVETKWTSYLRVGPGPQYAVQDELAMHTTLGLLGCQSGWCQVQSGRVTGYVREEALSDNSAPPATLGHGTDCFDTVVTGRPGGDHVRICRR